MRLLLCALSLLAGAGAAAAAQCPTPGDADAMVRAIGAAPSCRAAADIAKACAFGASGDVGLNAAVIEVCEKDFLAGLGAGGRAAYERQRAACRRKYAKQDGTMYRSMEAFCEAGVAERRSRAALARKRRN